MTAAQFVKNLSNIHPAVQFPGDVLEAIYSEVRASALAQCSDPAPPAHTLPRPSATSQAEFDPTLFSSVLLNTLTLDCKQLGPCALQGLLWRFVWMFFQRLFIYLFIIT
jgi:hypothetical protein